MREKLYLAVSHNNGSRIHCLNMIKKVGRNQFWSKDTGITSLKDNCKLIYTFAFTHLVLLEILKKLYYYDFLFARHLRSLQPGQCHRILDRGLLMRS